MHHVIKLSKGVISMAGLVTVCTSVTWVEWEGTVWGLVITKGILLVTVWTLYTPMNVCTYKCMVLVEKIQWREDELGRS